MSIALSVSRAKRKLSSSSFLVLCPNDMRTAENACEGLTPLFSSTRVCRFLPEEQADPVEIEKPRSLNTTVRGPRPGPEEKRHSQSREKTLHDYQSGLREAACSREFS